MCSAMTTETSTDTELQRLEDELQSLSSNTTEYDDPADSEDNAVAVERANRAARPTSGRRYSGSRNTTASSTGSDGSRTRARLRQRPGAARKLQKGGRQRFRNRGRKFRGKGRKGMRIQQTGAGSGRRLKSKNPTEMAASDREQSDAAYNAPPMSGVGGSSSAEGQEEMTNTLESTDGQKQRQRPGVPYQHPRSCDEMRCQRGGYCVTDERQGRRRARCRCPLGTKGHQCETGPHPSRCSLSVCLSPSHFWLIISHDDEHDGREYSVFVLSKYGISIDQNQSVSQSINQSINQFLQGISVAASPVLATIGMSVCPSVRHTLALSENDAS